MITDEEVIADLKRNCPRPRAVLDKNGQPVAVGDMVRYAPSPGVSMRHSYRSFTKGKWYEVLACFSMQSRKTPTGIMTISNNGYIGMDIFSQDFEKVPDEEVIANERRLDQENQIKVKSRLPY